MFLSLGTASKAELFRTSPPRQCLRCESQGLSRYVGPARSCDKIFGFLLCLNFNQLIFLFCSEKSLNN